MKVLVVEDDTTVSRMVCHIIKGMGHEVVRAEDGETALKLFENNRIDLILMDVVMPGIDGYETTRRIRNASGDNWFPIIFLSANTEDSYLTAGIEAGGDDYLFKPVKPIVLKAKINAMTRIVRMRRRLSIANRNLLKANKELQRLSCLDGLTLTVNRRGFDRQFEVEWRRCLRKSNPLSVMLIDLDQFKAFNDNCGHLAGDDCLKGVVRALKSQLVHPGDLLARYGGEEFAVLLPSTDEASAQNVANQCLEAVHRADIPHPASLVSDRVTISIGVFCTTQLKSESDDEQDKSTLLKSADEALYVAKEIGRNRVIFFDSQEYRTFAKTFSVSSQR